MLHLNDREWKEFFISGDEGIFEIKATKSGIDKNKLLDDDKHKIPYITRSDVQNGISLFVSEKQQKNYLKDNGNCITIGLDTQTVFYQPNSFYTGQNIQVLNCDRMTKEIALFICSMLKVQMKKFNWGGNGATLGRLSRTKIMLPINSEGSPDYEYMEQYVHSITSYKRIQYVKYCKQKITELGRAVTIKTVSETEWKPFPITQIFQTIIPGKGKGLNHLIETSDGVSYIGATNRNNGVMCYVSLNETSRTMLQDGNCIGFIKNGDGSAGYAIYKSEPFISTSDVLYGYADWLNQYTGLFFVSAQDMIEAKYSHGYKRNKQHLSGDKVMLPVTKTGEPDYDYMEQYAKNMMIRKYQAYLDYIEK